MNAMADFQDAFARALLDPDAPAGDMATLAEQPGFAVYRNTVMKACIDALQANYPAVARLVGEEWFRAAAAVFVREQPPAQPTLLFYGAGFADFLTAFEPAIELPYLPAVARLDRLWAEAHAAHDEQALTADSLAVLAPEALAAARVRPHAAARWAWCPEHPAGTLWRRNRTDLDECGAIDWRGEGALLTRAHDAVHSTALDAAGCAFLDACAAGSTLAAAAQAALGTDERADIAGLLAKLLAAGAFASNNPTTGSPA